MGPFLHGYLKLLPDYNPTATYTTTGTDTDTAPPTTTGNATAATAIDPATYTATAAAGAAAQLLVSVLSCCTFVQKQLSRLASCAKFGS